MGPHLGLRALQSWGERVTEGFNPAEWITTQQAAELTGYSPVSVRWMLRKGKVDGQKLGRDWLVNKQSVLEYVDRMKQLGTAKHDPTQG